MLRMPAVMVLAYASFLNSQMAPLPENWFVFAQAFLSELIFGSLLGFIPAMLFAGISLAGQLSATTMGLGAAQLMDPSLGVSVSSVGRIMGDLMVCVFLLIGGHYVSIYAAAGLGGIIVPGTFVLGAETIELLIDRSAQIFSIGVLLSAPVVVALLLTQFVMGLISKAIPTVNVFIVSFPLTIGIGLILTILTFDEIGVFMSKYWVDMEQGIIEISAANQVK
jgi:flagellar biosynthetic protein FliR